MDGTSGITVRTFFVGNLRREETFGFFGASESESATESAAPRHRRYVSTRERELAKINFTALETNGGLRARQFWNPALVIRASRPFSLL